MSYSRDSKIPVVDISPFLTDSSTKVEKEKVAKVWDEAFCTVGFAMIVGHGVPPDLISKFRSLANEFFEQDHAEKMKYHRGKYGSPEGGYYAMGHEVVSRSRDEMGSDGGANEVEASDENSPPLADLVESFILRPEQMVNDPMPLAAVAETYRAEMLRVLHALHEMSAIGLGLESTFFEPFYDTTDQHALRLGYYPAVSEPPSSTTMRYGAHTDYTGFTILLQDDGDNSRSGGLEVKLPDGSFHAVHSVPDSFVVNIGDMFQVWTNDRWKSTVHRVTAPAEACGSRLSIPFFSGPNNDARIEPILLQPGEDPKHETITAGEHYWRKLQATQT